MTHSTDRLTGFTSATKTRIYKEVIIIEYTNTACQLYKIHLIPWSIFLLQKLIVVQLVQKYPTFYCIQRFIVQKNLAFVPVLSQTNPLHSTPILFL
jgi:hypothetical protein